MLAGALALGYANIYVTAPSPENLRTLFEFVFKGLDACGYQVSSLSIQPGSGAPVCWHSYAMAASLTLLSEALYFL